jgi:hypothetical protein
MTWVTREHPRTDRIACPWLGLPVYDALYAWARDQLASGAG